MNRGPLIGVAVSLLGFPLLSVYADQVIMKDGSVYKGKIQAETDKAILIGNPPFDPTAYYLETKDIEKIIYEEYRPNAPAERKRGLTADLRISGHSLSSDELDMTPAAGLGATLGFRVHPLIELSGGMEWIPSLHADSDFAVSDGQDPPTVRGYQAFHEWRGLFYGRFYPFFQKRWKAEPYVQTGYAWGKIIPSGSGDSFSGSGWFLGTGFLWPLSRHFFLDARYEFQDMSYDRVTFLGRDGSLSPAIGQTHHVLSVGLSWRL